MKTKLLLIAILAVALFVRVYRTDTFLGFWYDQGRDALAVWDLWHNGKLFLIGPTTGIEGIFLGPFFYYLLAPFYILGGGNPVIPAVALAVMNVLGIYIIYRIGKDFFDSTIGLAAAFLVSLSFFLSQSHRWLSNPTPLPLFSSLAVYSLLKIIHGRPGFWPVLGVCVGLGLQLEAASATFFLPAVVLVVWINRRHVSWPPKAVVSAAALFAATLLPQLLFDFRHDHILLGAFRQFLVGQRSFRPELSGLLAVRLSDYFLFFTNKFFSSPAAARFFLLSALVMSISHWRKLFTRPFLAVVLWIAVPVLALLFYHGNRGFVWDYYFTGIYSLWALAVAVVFVTAARAFRPHFILAIVVFSLFVWENTGRHQAFLSQTYPDYVSLRPQIQAVDWVYQDAGSQTFNTDVYVPPVIPFAYDYLFLWRGTSRYGRVPERNLVPRLYTLYEPDNQHPQLLGNWLVRQAGIASPQAQVQFGPITVQRRTRIINQ